MMKESASAPTPPPTQPSLFDTPKGNEAVSGTAPMAEGRGAEKEKSSAKKERPSDVEDYERRGVSAIKDVEELAEQCLQDTIWMEAMKMGGFTRELIEGKLKEFVLRLRMEGKGRKTIMDFKSHFVRWMQKTAAIAKQQAQRPDRVVLDMESRMDIVRMTCASFKK